MLILEFSLKRQLCVCMYMYTLFRSVRNKISKSLLEEPMVLDKSDILFLQCVEVPRGAQMCPSILRALVALLCQYSLVRRFGPRGLFSELKGRRKP